jgi:hypothetical protein
MVRTPMKVHGLSCFGAQKGQRKNESADACLLLVLLSCEWFSSTSGWDKLFVEP